MSNLAANDVNGLMEAYQAVYDPDLREQLEEEREVEEVGLQIIENAAYVLFSQGYTVDDLIDYFSEADSEVITEDAMAISEGVLLVESVAVSDEYIAEQFEILYEGLGSFLLKQGGKLAQGAAKLLSGGGKKAEVIARAKNIQNIKNAKTAVPPGSAKVTQGAGGKPPTNTARITTSGGQTVGRNLFQRAGDWAKGVMKKIPGAGTVAKLAKGPVGKIAGRALPGVGAALYGADAVSRFKKGDWGGGLLSGAGAVTSLIPGAGLVAGLAPAAIQMATDAAGLTGDKSRKGPSAKTAPDKSKWNASKALGGKAAFTAGGGKEKMRLNPGMTAADVQKQGMINIRNKPAAAPASPAPAAPSAPARSSTATATTRTSPATPPKPPTGKLGGTTFERRTPTSAEFKGAQEYRQQNPNAKPEDVLKAAQEAGKRQTSVDTDLAKANTPAELNKPAPAGSALAAEQERRKKAEEEAKKQTVNASYEYDAFDLVLEYLLSEGHADTVDEALYVMMEMDVETIGSIVENRGMAHGGGTPHPLSGDGSKPRGMGGKSFGIEDLPPPASKKPAAKLK